MLTFRKTVFLFPVSVLMVEGNNQKKIFSDSLPSQLQLKFFKPRHRRLEYCKKWWHNSTTVTHLSLEHNLSLSSVWLSLASNTHVYSKSAIQPFKKSQTIKTKPKSRSCSLLPEANGRANVIKFFMWAAFTSLVNAVTKTKPPCCEVVKLYSLIKPQILFTLGARSPLLWKWKKSQMITKI